MTRTRLQRSPSAAATLLGLLVLLGRAAGAPRHGARSARTSCCWSWTSSRRLAARPQRGGSTRCATRTSPRSAADATWFRNAYSVYDSTTKAVPLILDGMRPRPGTAADRRYHPHSIYDMFARHGYRIVDSEEATALCPPSICRGGRTRRPAIIPNLLGGRPQRFNRWVRSITARPADASGSSTCCCRTAPTSTCPRARTRPRPRDLLPGMNTVPGFHDEFLTRHNEQRYLLQLGFTDRLLGQADPAAQARGDLRRHADRRDRRPRHRLPGRRRDAPQREPVERGGADAGAAVRQAPRPAPRADQRRLRPHARRDADDRRRAGLEARLPHRRPLGLRRRSRGAAGSR